MIPYFALFSWPVVVLILARSYTAPLAFALALVAGFLLLPERTSFDLPLLPAFDKSSVPVMSVLLFLALFKVPRAQPLPPLLPRHWFVRIALAGLILGTLMTVVTNRDPQLIGPVVLPGMQLYDGLSEILSTLLLLLPLLLARRFLARPEDHVLLLRVVCVAGLAYTLPALFEVRMSPQLHTWVYGFFQHVFIQHYRGGSWRPVVFLPHGLMLSLFFGMAVLATAGLFKMDTRRRGLLGLGLFWLVMTLVLSKSLGPLVITLVLTSVVLFLGQKGQLVVAGVVAVLVMCYPMARSADIVPVDRIERWANAIDPARAASFSARLENEGRMLEKARERPVFGWGRWGRSRVFDAETGNDITTSDGYWMIVMGVGGWVSYLLLFGLLCMPLGLLLLHRRRYGIGTETVVLALMLSANLLDLLPNASNTPFLWMLAGALWGRLELGRVAVGAQGATSMPRRPLAYSRPGEQVLQAREIDTPSGQQSRYTRQKSPLYRKHQDVDHG